MDGPEQARTWLSGVGIIAREGPVSLGWRQRSAGLPLAVSVGAARRRAKDDSVLWIRLLLSPVSRRSHVQLPAVLFLSQDDCVPRTLELRHRPVPAHCLRDARNAGGERQQDKGLADPPLRLDVRLLARHEPGDWLQLTCGGEQAELQRPLQLCGGRRACLQAEGHDRGRAAVGARWRWVFGRRCG